MNKLEPNTELKEICRLFNFKQTSYLNAIKEYNDFGYEQEIYEETKQLKYIIELVAQEILN